MLSQSLFDDNKVRVAGAPYSAGDFRPIGLGSLTANILCQKHNSELSPLDSAVRDFAELLKDVWAYEDRQAVLRAKFTKPHVKTKHRDVDGSLLQRWFLKTAINFAYIFTSITTIADHDLLDPPKWMLDTIFDDCPVPEHCGLYTTVNLDATTEQGNEFSFAEVTSDPQNLVGFLTVFRMFRFAIWLIESPAVDVQTPQPGWDGWTLLGPQPEGFNVANPDGSYSQWIHYRW